MKIKKIASIIIVFSMLTLLFGATPVGASGIEISIDEPHAEGVVLVGFVPGTPAAERAKIRQSVDIIHSQAISPLAVDAEKMQLRPGMTVEKVITILLHNPNVRYAEPDYLLQLQVESNDPYYINNYLWGMYGDETSPSNIYGSGAGEAWADGYTGSQNVYVGVIDEGIQYTHPDLVDNIWTNTYDPIDGLDNDGNGYVDDVRGWDFYSDDNTVYDSRQDDHGTHVAGTIGAEGGNSLGVAGVNWNVTMISAKFLGPRGGYTSDAIAALDYLTALKTEKGINIVATSNSWGGGGYSNFLLAAINRSGEAGILFVAAAGNNGSNNDENPFYPASYPSDYIISVASITSSGSKSSFSNYGADSVDIGAPGSGIYSTVPTNSYASYSGTSMATPHVTGAIALCASINPSLTALDLKTALLESSAYTLSLDGRVATNGRLDIGAMVSLIPTVDGNEKPIADPQTVNTDEDTSVDITLTGSDPDGDSITYFITSGPSNGIISGIVPDITYTPNLNFNGADSLTFTVNDGLQDSEPAMVTIHVTPVNDAPVADPQSVETSQDTPVVFTLTGSDVDGDTLGYDIVDTPSNGTLSTNAIPNLTYTPAPGFTGTDSFTFRVYDGQIDSETAIVSITVTEVPPTPTINVDITMSSDYRSAGRNTFVWAIATMEVTVEGLPVEGATVIGHWENATTDTDSGITDINGKVSLQSDQVKYKSGSITFYFEVDEIVISGISYYPVDVWAEQPYP